MIVPATVEPGAIGTPPGVVTLEIESDGGVLTPPETTVITVCLACVGSAAGVAVMTAVPGFCVAVTTPVFETLATDVSEDTYVTAVFDEPVTTETRFTVWPATTVAVDGVSVNVTVPPPPGAGMTVTTAAACLFVRNFDVAMIVVEPGATAVTTPVVALTVATAGFDDEYVTPACAPVVSLETCPTNVAVWPTAIVAVAGVMVTSGSGRTMTLVVLSSQAAKARALSDKSASLRNADVRTFMCSPP
jgi:hypothetical protein